MILAGSATRRDLREDLRTALCSGHGACQEFRSEMDRTYARTCEKNAKHLLSRDRMFVPETAMQGGG